MKATKNIWTSFLNNRIRVPAINGPAPNTALKEPATNSPIIRATDINIYYGEG